MPDFVLEFFTRYGLDAMEVVANAAWVLGVVQLVKQYIPQITRAWTWLAALVVAFVIGFMAYGALGIVPVLIASVTMAIASIVGKNWLNQFVPGKSIKDKRNGGAA